MVNDMISYPNNAFILGCGTMQKPRSIDEPINEFAHPLILDYFNSKDEN